MALPRQGLSAHPFILLLPHESLVVSAHERQRMGRENHHSQRDPPQSLHLLPPAPRPTLGRHLALQRQQQKFNVRSRRTASALELLFRSLQIGVHAFPARRALEGDVRHGTAVSGGLVHVYVADDWD